MSLFGTTLQWVQTDEFLYSVLIGTMFSDGGGWLCYGPESPSSSIRGYSNWEFAYADR